jgi:CRISPR-associated protein Csx10
MHNEIEDEKGTTVSGVLFATSEIPPGTPFTGYVRCLDSEARDILNRYYPSGEGVLRVGRDRGRADVSWEAVPDGAEPYVGKGTFEERFPEPEAGPIGFTLTLLSDAILRDPWGRFHRTLDLGYLRSALDCGEDLRFARDSEGLAACFAGYRLVSGWRATHNLFTPKTVAVAQGSAARLVLMGNAVKGVRERLRLLERNGLGEQRAQGFGRVLINDGWHQQAQTAQIWREPPEVT